MILFMGRHFYWQPSECEDRPLDVFLADFEAAKEFLKLEREAQEKGH